MPDEPSASNVRELTPTVQAVRAALDGLPREPGVGKPDPILVGSHIKRRFGGLVAVQVEHVEVQRGTITALIGPNGAGKTTLFNLLTGFDQAEFGRVDIRGPRVSPAPYRVARVGHGPDLPAHQGPVPDDSPGQHAPGGDSATRGILLPGPAQVALGRSGDCQHRARARVALPVQPAGQEDDFAGSLSGGQRKLLEMARALMTEPTMVMLDEPMAGVNPALTQSLLGHIKDLREQGMTVLFVEHDMDMVRDISDWVIVMAQGAIIAEGPPEEVMANTAVIDAYLGAHHDQALTESGESLQED